MFESEMEIDVVPSARQTIDVVGLLNRKVKEIEQGVTKKEPRIIQKVMSRIFSIRKLLTDEILSELLAQNCFSKENLGHWIQFEPKGCVQEMKFPEVDAFLHFLVLLKLQDSGKHQDALSCVESLMQKVCSSNRRTMDSISAKVYFYYSRVYELNDIDNGQNWPETSVGYEQPINVVKIGRCGSGKLDKIRNFLISRLRTCTLKSDIAGQAVLINCILRNYLEYNLYQNADVFVGKVKFPDQADNNEWARFLYYLARIKATRLEYTEAQKNVTLALRKAPDSSASGFKQAATKLAICIDLLLGDIPDKKIFNTCKLKNSLEPYFKLSQAVRDGNLTSFGEVLESYGKTFQKDHTYNLILRLRRNVIKIGIRTIGLSYSKISPTQVAKKLGLDNSEEAMFIIAKAIRDGVLEASIIQGYLVSQEVGDIYKTLIPSDIYKERIAACLQLHNQTVKSMRYPMKKYESKLGSSDELDEADEDFDMFLI